MNPWGQAPAIKKFPLGDVQRILSNSSSYAAYTPQQTEEPSTEEQPKRDTTSSQISQECENLLRINTEITDLNTNFEALELFLKYNDLISDESIKKKIKTVEDLTEIIYHISQAKIFEKSVEKQEQGPALKNFVTVDYAYRKALIQMLKLIKQNERQLEKGKVLGVREDSDTQDLLNYFYSKGGRVEEICKEVIELCQGLISKNEKLGTLFTKR